MLAVLPARAAPQGCAALRILTSVQMRTNPDRTTMLVPVTIDDAAKNLLLDTGGAVSEISRATADQLELPTRGTQTRVYDMQGNVSGSAVTIPDFVIGGENEHAIHMQVAADPGLGKNGPIDGRLATDLFHDSDIDMDFGAARLTAFSSEHCEGRVVYWNQSQKPVAVVPTTLRDNHIGLQVTVDGHPLNAVLDTGSQYSVMNADLARRIFGLDPEPFGPPQPGSGHIFSDVAFAGVEITNMRVHVMNDRMTASPPFLQRYRAFDRRFGADLAQPDLIIGMDVLRHLHIYLAQKEHRLYITEAVPGESALFQYKAGDTAAVPMPAPAPRAGLTID